MLKIRRPLGRLIFNMGIAIPGKTVFLIETAPRYQYISLLIAQSSNELKWYNLITIATYHIKEAFQMISHLNFIVCQSFDMNVDSFPCTNNVNTWKIYLNKYLCVSYHKLNPTNTLYWELYRNDFISEVYIKLLFFVLSPCWSRQRWSCDYSL